MFKKGASVFWK